MCGLVALAVVGGPAAVAAATDADVPHAGSVLFGFAILLLTAKAGGLLAERLRAPAVLGELLAGVGLSNLVPPLLGAGGIRFVLTDPTLRVLAEIGVLILLFDVGLEVDVRALLRVGWSSLLVALIGLAAPLLLGWAAAAWLLPDRPALVHVFVGACLSATSVGITARVLRDLGVTERRESRIILGAAIIDDVLGLVLLAVVTGAVAAAAGDEPALSPLGAAGMLARAVGFLAVTVGAGHLVSPAVVRLAARTGQHGILLVFGLALCFCLAFVAELVGLAGIIGAFAAGVMLDPYGQGVRTREEEATLSELIHPLSSLFVPLFFILIGLQVDLAGLIRPDSLGLGLALVVGAVAGKLAAAVGVLDRQVDRLAVGIGMVPRGEVGLVFAGIGSHAMLGGSPLLSPSTFSAVVLMVIVTTLLGPIGLRWAFGRRSR